MSKILVQNSKISCKDNEQVFYSFTLISTDNSLLMPCPFTGLKMFWAGPNFLCQTKIYLHIVAVTNILCQTKR